MSAKAHVPHPADDLPAATTLPAESGKKLVGAAAAVLVLGLLLAGVAAFVDVKRLGFSYLTGFMWTVTIGLGALFFVIIQHLTKAGWSVAARRHMEWISQILIGSILLFVPIFFFAHDLYHHWMGPQAATDEIIQKKAAWLNPSFFYLRAVIYCVIWAVLAWWFARTSRRQDETKDPALSLKMQGASAPAVILFALSTTFAAFDWVMSLDPHWYSTIFGVYIFAGGILSAMAMLAIVTIVLQRGGYLGRYSTIEHLHDIGKLTFGFTVFWAYIGFSQFLLIWYANIPEETIYYRQRWEGSWKIVSLLLLGGHFVLPFLVLLPRTTKRTPMIFAGAAAWLLLMHYVDLYWMIMPTLDHHGAHPSWIDLAGLLLPAGLLFLVVAAQAVRGPLYPVGDPRLAESTKNVNL